METHYEKGAQSFCECVKNLSLKENPIVCWKFCYVLHKVLQEGHAQALSDLQIYKSMLLDHGTFWGFLKKGHYGEIIKCYCNLLHVKLNFHSNYPKFHGNLRIEEGELFQAEENGLLNLLTEMLNYLEGILELQNEIFQTMGSSCKNAATNAGQCRLKPLIPCLEDSQNLYDQITKVLHYLLTKLSPNILTGHRDRFLKIIEELEIFYSKTKRLQCFKNVLQIQNLEKNQNLLARLELIISQPTPSGVNELEDTATGTTNGSASLYPDLAELQVEMERLI